MDGQTHLMMDGSLHGRNDRLYRLTNEWMMEKINGWTNGSTGKDTCV